MLILEVFKGTHQRKGQKKDGTEFTVRYQEAEIRRQGKRPRPIEVSVPRDGAYVEGLYTLSANSFRPDDYDRLALSPYIRLTPLDDAIKFAEDAEKEASTSTTRKR